jgi:hypothetical protein
MRPTNGSYDPNRCAQCGHAVGKKSVCSCGAATANMSFAERSEFELEQWRAYKARESVSA